MDMKLKRPIGIVDVILIDKDSKSESSVTLKNAVLPTAIPLIARALGGDSNYIIDTMEIYLDDALLASSNTIPSYPDNETVKFSAIFDSGSFSGEFNKCILKNYANGEFSLLENFSLTKQENNILSIGWNIKPQ